MTKNASPAVASRTRPAARRPGAAAMDAAADTGLAGRAQRFAAEWAPTAGRIMLGLVLAWFGYHELVQPQLWTGYVPVIPATSTFALVLVLVHGWILLMLAVAIVAGVALRLAAAVAALLLAQIVITLTVTGGLTDLTLRDVGVLGLAVCLSGGARQRAALTR
ncbi:MAG TPA: hypothetical protein VN840_21080 [Streptosporangiaceae bacterium]|nr:hypothetical protein [Streptosporangiaceae bacterium]